MRNILRYNHKLSRYNIKNKMFKKESLMLQ